MARDQARKMLASVALGIVDDKPVKSHITYEETRTQFIEMSRRHNKPRTTKDYERLLTVHFKFKGKKLIDIEKVDLQRCLNKLDKTPSEYRHAFSAIRTLFNWAYKEELIERNPADRLRRPQRAIARKRVLDDYELTEVLKQAFEFEGSYGAITALCALTGQRRGEITMLQWDWINEETKTITLPGALVKNGRTHTFPYGKLVEQILDTVPRTDKHLFAGHTEGSEIFNGWSKCKKRFDGNLENVAPYTLHDLRRTFSTLHARLGTPIHVTEKLLNHVSGTVSGVAAIYNRYSYMTEMKEAVEHYDETVEQTSVKRVGTLQLSTHYTFRSCWTNPKAG